MIYLRHNTASQEVPLGYFLDSSDGNTEEDALTIANTDILIWKTGATALVAKNSGGATHMQDGVYYAVLDATDTNTLGPLKIFVHMAGALVCTLECAVIQAQEYDRLFTTLGHLHMGILSYGTAQSATGTGVVLAASEAYADDVLIGVTAVVYGSTQGYGQARQVTDNALTGDSITVDAFGVTPSGTISYILFATPPAVASGTLPAVNVTQIAGQTASASGTVTFPSGTLASTTNITAGTITTVTNVTTVNGLAANVITASALATDAREEIADAVWDEAIAEHVAAGSVGATLNDVLGDTSQLSFSTANRLDVNVRLINSVSVIGAGTAIDKWRGA